MEYLPESGGTMVAAAVDRSVGTTNLLEKCSLCESAVYQEEILSNKYSDLPLSTSDQLLMPPTVELTGSQAPVVHRGQDVEKLEKDGGGSGGRTKNIQNNCCWQKQQQAILNIYYGIMKYKTHSLPSKSLHTFNILLVLVSFLIKTIFYPLFRFH